MGLRNAELQTPRVAKVRDIDPSKVQDLIRQNTDKADFGVLGADGVNILTLNLALDQLGGK
ncbi:MAG: potassium-transporting ATPase subunit C [Verrucomicrobiota bacterium]